MVTPTLQKIIVGLLVLIVLGLFGYAIFIKEPDPSALASVDLVSIDTASQEIIVLIDKLNTISIDPVVFSSPLFTSLVDFQVALFPEAQGRQNPFAIIGSDSGVAAVVSAPTKTKTTKSSGN